MDDRTELVAEARKVAAMYRHAGLRFGVEPLLDRLADALEESS